jgi:geranylgeranyl diphosphate synthase type I
MITSFSISDKALANAINMDLERFAKLWRKDDTIGSHEPVDVFCDVMLRGGKRLRGILAMKSYYAYGGKDEEVAIGIARVFEIVQTSLLIVDDIADRSELRRGGLSAHKRIEMYAKANDMKGSALHYGQVQTMNIAYAGLHQSTIELLRLPVDAEISRRACRRFHENIAITINGQIDDIYNEATKHEVSESAIESVSIRKTAYYTILNPIELGAFLAGVTSIPLNIRKYSIHTGCAFQIADDIISTFGAEDKTGKGQDDDIHQGKLTLLVHHALIHGTAVQQTVLKATLGNLDATPSECNEVRQIFIATGALEYAKVQLRMQEKAALEALADDKVTDSYFLDYLMKLTNYIVNRLA